MASTTANGRGAPPAVADPPRIVGGFRTRVAILGVVVLAVFGALLLRLWAHQVLSGTHYLRAAQNNQLRTIRVQAPRGPIVDRNGRLLVTNVPGISIRIWPTDLPKDGRYDELRRLARLVLVDALFPSILLNLVLTAPVYALCRRLLRPPEWSDLATEVRLLG